MFISQTGLTYFYKWPITCKIQILNLIKCGSGICNRCDQRLFLLASRFFCLAKSLWNQVMRGSSVFHGVQISKSSRVDDLRSLPPPRKGSYSKFYWEPEVLFLDSKSTACRFISILETDARYRNLYIERLSTSLNPRQ
jgi:hypothetical protein